MRQRIQLAAAVAALCATSLAPLAAGAATTSTSAEPARFAMETQLYDTRRPGAVVGKMLLNVYPNGIVNGNYFPDDGPVRTVTGGTSGDNVWLDIGGIHTLHLNGTLKNGVLKATAFIPGPDTYVFESYETKRLN